MSSTVRTVTPDSSLDEVLAVLAEHRLTTLPVVQAGAVIAMVGEADVIRALVGSDPRRHALPSSTESVPPTTVEEVMSAPAFTVRPDEDVRDVARVLAQHGWKSAAVVDADRLVGVLSRSDVIQALYRPDPLVEAEIVDVLEELGVPGWDVKVRHGTAELTGPDDRKLAEAVARAAMTVPGVRRVQHEASTGTSRAHEQQQPHLPSFTHGGPEPAGDN